MFNPMPNDAVFLFFRPAARFQSEYRPICSGRCKYRWAILQNNYSHTCAPRGKLLLKPPYLKKNCSRIRDISGVNNQRKSKVVVGLTLPQVTGLSAATRLPLRVYYRTLRHLFVGYSACQFGIGRNQPIPIRLIEYLRLACFSSTFAKVSLYLFQIYFS
jgi:hypothetical protein